MDGWMLQAVMCSLWCVQGDSTVVGTSKLRDLYERFEEELGRRQERAKATRPKWDPPKTKLDEDPGGWALDVLPGLRRSELNLRRIHRSTGSRVLLNL